MIPAIITLFFPAVYILVAYQRPFLIRPAIKTTEKSVKIRRPEIHTGQNTHSQGQEMLPVNLSTTKRRVNVLIKPMPPFLTDLPALLFWVSLFFISAAPAYFSVRVIDFYCHIYHHHSLGKLPKVCFPFSFGCPFPYILIISYIISGSRRGFKVNGRADKAWPLPIQLGKSRRKKRFNGKFGLAKITAEMFSRDLEK